MKIYLVGGAVRDKLLGLPVKERDWVVVGATPKKMLDMGYKQVGKDFPVFLHPETQEEYALARTERKVRPGYDGFEVHADPTITLEQDLLRRDLTINAIAEDDNGKIIDHFNGVEDLKSRVLRHVSAAFSEDPLRLVRLCRFQAKLPAFEIHHETLAMCQDMVDRGEINHLTAERVWLEWQKAFKSGQPSIFIKTLQRVKAWPILMPAFDQPDQDAKHVALSAQTIQDDRLMATLGWYLAPSVLKTALKSLRLPKEIVELSALVYDLNHYQQQMGQDLSAKSLVDAFYRWDVFRRMQRFQQAIELLESVIGQDQAMKNTLRIAAIVAQEKLNKSEIQTLSGEQIAKLIYQKRLEACQKSL